VKKIGYSLVYIIQRKQETGSAIEKDEKLVRIHFGLDDKVSKIIPIGLPLLPENEKGGAAPGPRLTGGVSSHTTND
jgi:hypothetical protein